MARRKPCGCTEQLSSEGILRIAVHIDGSSTEDVRLLWQSGYREIASPCGAIDASVATGSPVEVLRFAKALRAGGFRGPIVAGSNHSGPGVNMLRTAGINAIAATADVSELLCTVHEYLGRRDNSVHAPLSLPLDMQENARSVQVGAVRIVLTETQFRLLSYLAARTGKWVKASELRENVLQTHCAPDSTVVRVHIGNLRQALGPAGWCVQSERTFGYTFLTDADALLSLGARRRWHARHCPASVKVFESRPSGLYSVFPDRSRSE